MGQLFSFMLEKPMDNFMEMHIQSMRYWNDGAGPPGSDRYRHGIWDRHWTDKTGKKHKMPIKNGDYYKLTTLENSNLKSSDESMTSESDGNKSSGISGILHRTLSRWSSDHSKSDYWYDNFEIRNADANAGAAGENVHKMRSTMKSSSGESNECADGDVELSVLWPKKRTNLTMKQIHREGEGMAEDIVRELLKKE